MIIFLKVMRPVVLKNMPSLLELSDCFFVVPFNLLLSITCLAYKLKIRSKVLF